MKRVVVDAVQWALAAAVAAVVAGVVRPDDRDLVVDAFVLFVGAVALHAVVRATRLAAPGEASSQLERALRPPRPHVPRAEDLQALERTVLLATETASDFHFRLRPVLQEIASHRLTTRLGLDLNSPRAPETLGAAWEHVRPDAKPPSERFARGVPLDDLRAAVTALERI